MKIQEYENKTLEIIKIQILYENARRKDTSSEAFIIDFLTERVRAMW
jgi:hypothetical protein